MRIWADQSVAMASTGSRDAGLPAFVRALAAPVSGPSGRQFRSVLPSVARPSLFGSD